MFEEFFHLRENPFALAPNPRFIFRSHEHTEALAHLRYWIENGEGFVLITGEVGTGKTTALFDLMGQLPSEWAVAFVANSTLTAAELLEEICRRFQVEIPAVASKPALLERLEGHLAARSDRGLGSVLILDEAQNYENRLLEEVRLLSNLERATGKLIQIALVGQPELERKLEQPELRQLRQRIGIRYRLNPLSEEETIRYLHHRLAVAGGDAERILLPESAIEVHRLTHGIPREINIVASQALISAFVQGAAQVTPDHVRGVVLDFAWSSILGRGPLPPVARSWERGARDAAGTSTPVSALPPVSAPPPASAPPPMSAVTPSAQPPASAPPPATALPDRPLPVDEGARRPPLEIVRGRTGGDRGEAPAAPAVASASPGTARAAQGSASAAPGSASAAPARPPVDPALREAARVAAAARARERERERAWIDSLTEEGPESRRWRTVGLWALLIVGLAAGAALAWSQRSALLHVVPFGKPEKSRGAVEERARIPVEAPPNVASPVLPAGRDTARPDTRAAAGMPAAAASTDGVKPAAGKPAGAKPTAVKPAAATPAAAKPAAAKLPATKPQAQAPGRTAPATAAPATTAPATIRPRPAPRPPSSGSAPRGPALPEVPPDSPRPRVVPAPYAAIGGGDPGGDPS